MCWDHAQASAAAPALQNSLPTNVPSREMTFFPIHHISEYFSLNIYPTSLFLRENYPVLTSPRATAEQFVPEREWYFSQLLVLQCCKTKQKTNPSVST